MTEKLYEVDSYVQNFTAQVVSCTPVPGGFAVVLDRTAFFPEGGGQPCDTGRLGGARVLAVHTDGEPITPPTATPLPAGEPVAGWLEERTGDVRLVEAGGDCCACCGTHLTRTGEVGLIKIISFAHYKSGMRLAVACGQRAYDAVAGIWADTEAAGRLLSSQVRNQTPPLEPVQDTARLPDPGPHPASGGASATFSLRAKSRLRRLRSDTRLRAQPRRGRLTAERLLPREKLRLSKKVCSPLGPLCEGAPPAGGGGENCTAVRNISGYGKVLSLRPFGAPPSQREVF